MELSDLFLWRAMVNGNMEDHHFAFYCVMVSDALFTLLFDS